MRVIRGLYMSVNDEVMRSFWIGVILGLAFTYMP